MARKRGVKAGKAEALDEDLKAMFRTLEQRPTPETIKAVIDQLEAPAKPGKPKR
jgi:hypothetical protein